MQQITNKKDIPETLVVEIEKLSNLGYGIARLDGYVLFVEGACPGDKVKIKVGKKPVKRATVKGNVFTLKLSSKLKAKTKITITVSKKKYMMR